MLTIEQTYNTHFNLFNPIYFMHASISVLFDAIGDYNSWMKIIYRTSQFLIYFLEGIIGSLECLLSSSKFYYKKVINVLQFLLLFI